MRICSISTHVTGSKQPDAVDFSDIDQQPATHAVFGRILLEELNAALSDIDAAFLRSSALHSVRLEIAGESLEALNNLVGYHCETETLAAVSCVLQQGQMQVEIARDTSPSVTLEEALPVLKEVLPSGRIQQQHEELLSYLAANGATVVQGEDGTVVPSEDIAQLQARLSFAERQYEAIANSKLGRLQRKYWTWKRKIR